MQDYYSAPGPSPADKTAAKDYPKTTAIQVDMIGKPTVNFYGPGGIIFSMTLKNFMKMGK